MGRGKRLAGRRRAAPLGRAKTVVRAATRADVPALAALKRRVAARAYSEAGHAGDALEQWLDAHAGEAYFSYRVGRKDYHVLLIEEQGRVVGYGGFRKRGSRADGNSVGLYVEEPGRGLGALLDQARVDLARNLGCTRMRVSVWRTNEPARRFVEGRGFRRTGGYREGTVGVRVDHYERDL